MAEKKNQNLRWKKERWLAQQHKTTSTKMMVAVVTSLVTVSVALAPTVMATKNKTRSKDFQPRMVLRYEKKRRMWKGWYVNQRDFFL